MRGLDLVFGPTYLISSSSFAVCISGFLGSSETFFLLELFPSFDYDLMSGATEANNDGCGFYTSKNGY